MIRTLRGVMRKDKYYPPKMGEEQFNCPRCGVFASQYWDMCHSRNSYGGGFVKTEIGTAFCSHCYKFSYWLGGILLYPEENNVEMYSDDLPEECRGEYIEARSIVSRSPRGAAALLRLCIQKLLIELGKKGKSINDGIGELVKEGLPKRIQKSLDICRVVGNNAVHPGEIDIRDNPDIAHILFKLVNLIVQDRITKEKEIDAVYNSLPEGAREKIKERDGKG